MAVGASAAWWGLSREPRGPRGLSSFVRDSRRGPRSLLRRLRLSRRSTAASVSPAARLEAPTPLSSYLWAATWASPALPSLPWRRILGTGRAASRSPPPASAAQRVHHVYPTLPTPLLRSSRRLPHRECGSLSSRFVITPRRRYPIHQAQYSLLGPLPTVC
ncbi:hypothetical protein LEMLEM_LOCUS18478 [Lemmus lemmus]